MTVPLPPSLPQGTAPGIGRRRFLHAGFTAASALALLKPGPSAVRGAEGSGAVGPIDPGFIGPSYFDEAERLALLEVFESASPFRYWGPGRPDKVTRFEEAFARHMGTRFALGVTSGTAALDCAMAALGVGPGDEVIVPAYTWWSDYTCVVQAGALPVFADIDESLNLDPTDFERKISPRTKAVIAVHLLGGPCDLDPILEVAERRRVAVVEDCAQCVGGSHRGRRLGSIGAIGIYSFQINKVITSGEGGAVVTQDPLLYERAVRFHDMGSIRSPFTDRLGKTSSPMFAGENFRMSELTGAVLGAQLPKLDRMIADLRGHAERVRRGAAEIPGLRLRRMPDPAGDIGFGVYFSVGSRVTRDRWIAALRQRGVPASTLTGSVLLPIEESVIQKRARASRWPSFESLEGRAIRYGSECCRRTLEVFDHFVQVRMGVRYTDRIDEYLVTSLREVAAEVGRT